MTIIPIGTIRIGTTVHTSTFIRLSALAAVSAHSASIAHSRVLLAITVSDWDTIPLVSDMAIVLI